MAGEADSVSSLTASACHIGGRTDVNPGEQTLVYGIKLSTSHSQMQRTQNFTANVVAADERLIVAFDDLQYLRLHQPGHVKFKFDH